MSEDSDRLIRCDGNNWTKLCALFSKYLHQDHVKSSVMTLQFRPPELAQLLVETISLCQATEHDMLSMRATLYAVVVSYPSLATF